VYRIQILYYPCIRFPSIIPDNREYTVVLAILFESPKGPSDEKRLGPTKEWKGEKIKTEKLKQKFNTK
jgi:hypothetical protein